MKKIIGLIPLYDDERDSYWMLPGYMRMLEFFGAVPVMLPLSEDKEELEECIALCDGFLLTGGHDVDPMVYGKRKESYCGKVCELRDRMECYLVDAAMKKDIPVLGICRGLQLINAHLGGDLYQDISLEYGTTVKHHMEPPYNRAVHRIKVLPDTLLADIMGEGYHEVNSYHHQAVRKRAESVDVMAFSEDGLIEAVSVKDKRFIVGVQWHPEFAYKSSEDSRLLIQAFVDVCKNG